MEESRKRPSVNWCGKDSRVFRQRRREGKGKGRRASLLSFAFFKGGGERKNRDKVTISASVWKDAMITFVVSSLDTREKEVGNRS